MTVIIFNGPPRSGKDTAAKFIQHHYGYEHRELKFSLHEFVKAEWRLLDCEWEEMYESKDLPYDVLGGMTPRQAMIEMSENYMKPKFGPCIFGRLLSASMKSYQDYVISDCGFREEIEPLVEKFGETQVVIVRINRDGCDYSNDSRGPYDPQWFPNVECIDVYNNGTEQQFYEVLTIALSHRLFKDKHLPN